MATIAARFVPFLMNCLSTLPLLASLAIAPFTLAYAEKADRHQPMNIEADALRHDELQQSSVFTGRVVLTKGSIVLRGDRLEVHQDADGYQSGTVTAAAGQRAFFRQKRDAAPGAPEEFVEGEGERIEYNGRTDTVRLLRRAELRRYQGAKLQDELTGAVIVYNNLTDVFSVDGQPRGVDGAAAPGGRVRAILAPKATPAPASPAAAVPASSSLRSSPALGSPKP